MHMKTAVTHLVKVYLSGPIEEAKQIIRRECMEEGLCVTIEPTHFIYSGGEEAGYVVGFANYPRFPLLPDELERRAMAVAERLLLHTFQKSAMVVTPDKTFWLCVELQR